MQVPMTPLRFLHRSTLLYGDKDAVICGDAHISFRDFQERANRLSNALSDMGVRQGDRVAYLALNCHRMVEGYYGVPQIGAVLLCINVRLTPREISFIIRDATPTVLVLSHMLMPVWDAIKDACPSVRHVVLMEGAVAGREWPGYEEVIAAQPATTPPAVTIDENDTAGLFYTSGTTANPKGVMLSYRNVFMHAVSSIISLGYNDRTVQLVGTVPLFHVNAWGSPHSLIASGGTQVVVPRFDPRIACEAVQKTRATWLLLVPSMLNALLNFPDLRDYDLSSLERIILGGAPCPYTLIEQAREALHCECLVGYGLTETTPIVSIATLKSSMENDDQLARDRRQAMTGIPAFAIDIEIMDDDDQPVPHDGTSRGEICVRADSVMKGYWNRPDEDEQAFRNGWFHTGDVATMDGEGYLNIVDRKKDIIVSGGENISTAEIEDVLFSHPAILETAVIGVPDPKWGEAPRAIVVLRPDRQASSEELLIFCRSRLAGFKAPRQFEFVSELPKTGTGKVQKHVLREKFWQGHETNVL